MIHRQPNRPPQRNRASLIVLIVLAFLLMIGAGVLVSQLPEDEAWQFGTMTGQTSDRQLTGFDCDAAEAQTLYPFQDGLVKVTPDRIASLDILGSERFAIDVDFSAPYAVKNGQWLMVADRDGTGYIMLTPDGEAYHGQLSGNIGGIAVSRDGMAALIQDRQDSTGVVTILEAGTGRHLFDCFFPQSGYVLSAAFSPDGSYFDVSIVNTDGSAIYPILKRYAVNGSQVGQLLPELTDLYPLLVHDGQGNPVISSFTGLSALSYDQDQPLWRYTYTRIHAVSANERGIWVLASERLNGPVNLMLIDLAGQQTRLLEVGDTVVGPALAEELAAVGSGSRVLVINSKTGRLIQEVNLPADVIRLDFSDSGSLIIVTAGGVSRLPIGQ